MRKGMLKIVMKNIIRSHSDRNALPIALLAAQYLPEKIAAARVDKAWAEVV